MSDVEFSGVASFAKGNITPKHQKCVFLPLFLCRLGNSLELSAHASVLVTITYKYLTYVSCRAMQNCRPRTIDKMMPTVCVLIKLLCIVLNFQTIPPATGLCSIHTSARMMRGDKDRGTPNATEHRPLAVVWGIS